MSAKNKPVTSAPARGMVNDRRNDRQVGTKQACRILNIKSRSTIHRRMRDDPRFPPPTPSQMGANHWWESDLFAYLDLPKRPEITRAK